MDLSSQNIKNEYNFQRFTGLLICERVQEPQVNNSDLYLQLQPQNEKQIQAHKNLHCLLKKYSTDY